MIPSWNSWVLSSSTKLLQWIHGFFYCWYCGFSLWSVAICLHIYILLDTPMVLLASSCVLSSFWLTGQFISSAMNSLNDLSLRGLVNIADYVLSIGKCYIYWSPCATLSVTNKYLVLMFLVSLELKNYINIFMKVSHSCCHA